jgi:hypothetical protein
MKILLVLYNHVYSTFFGLVLLSGPLSVCDDDDRRPTSMADDSRSLAPRRRPHRPVLIVANPGPDSDSDGPNDPSAHRPYYYPYSHNDPPSSSPPSPSIEKAFPVHLPSSREPGPLTTANLPHSRPHPASQSNPALSSPSAGTSSPPPSTPGQSLPPTDLVTEPASRLAISVGPSNSSDALLQQQHTPLHSGSVSHLFGKVKAHIPIPRIHHDRRLSGSSRTNSVCLSFASATPSMLTNCSVSNRLYSIRPGC